MNYVERILVVACLASALAHPSFAAPTPTERAKRSDRAWSPRFQDARSIERLFRPTPKEIDDAISDLEALREQHRRISIRLSKDSLPPRLQWIVRPRVSRWASDLTLPRFHRECLARAVDLDPSLIAVVLAPTKEDLTIELANRRRALEGRYGLADADSRTLILLRSAEFFHALIRGDSAAARVAFEQVHVERLESWSEIHFALALWESDPTAPARNALLVDRAADVVGGRSVFAILRFELAWRALDRAADLATRARVAATLRDVLALTLPSDGAATDLEFRVFRAAAVLGSATHDDGLTAGASLRLAAFEAAAGNADRAQEIDLRIADDLSSAAAPIEVAEATWRAGIRFRDFGNFTDSARMFDRLDRALRQSPRPNDTESAQFQNDSFAIARELATTYEAAGQYRRAYGWWVAAERRFPKEVPCGNCAAAMWERIAKAKQRLWREIERIDALERVGSKRRGFETREARTAFGR